MIVNSDVVRFDLLKGPFNKNDQLTASPYTDSFLYIPNITFNIANQVLPVLNNAKTWKRDETEQELWSQGVVDVRYRAWLEEMVLDAGVSWRDTTGGNLTFGYVTKDVRFHLIFGFKILITE